MKILDGIDGITVQMLTHKDVVRHRLVQQIIKAQPKKRMRKRRKTMKRPDVEIINRQNIFENHRRP